MCLLLKGGHVYHVPPLSVSAVPLCCRIPDITLGVGGGGMVDAGGLGVWGSGLVVGALACLPEEVDPWSILPLGTLHIDPVFRHPGSSYAAVGGAHQSDCNPTLDLSARLRV